MVLIEFRRPEKVRLVGRSAGEIALRQVRPVAGHRLIGAPHRNAAAVALAAERLRSGIAGRAAPDDNDRSRDASRRHVRMRRNSLQLLANVHGANPRLGRCELARHIAHLFDAPSGNRVQRRRAEGFARAQAEAGMMPGAANRFANQEPLD